MTPLGDDSIAAAPVLSVAVCTRDRPEALRATLESLCGQTLPRQAFEVVVVDDGSGDATREAARAFASRLPLRYSRQRRAGIASARNHAIFLARGAVLAFLDDGVAAPTLLEAHLEAHRRFPEPCFAVVGEARLAPALAADPLMHFVTTAEELLPLSPRAADGTPLDHTHFVAGRSSCKRRFLLQRGVFDPLFRSLWEDRELAWRLSRHGLRVIHAARATSTFTRSFSLGEFCDRMRRDGEARALLARLHGREAAWGPGGGGAPDDGVMPAGVRDVALRSAADLDRLARARLEAGLSVDEGLRALLHRSYLAAFRALRSDGAAG